MRLSNLSSGIPEESWQTLLDELARVLTKDGWLQVIDCNIVNQLDTESKQWKESVVITESKEPKSDQDGEGNKKSRTLAQIRQMERVGQASKFSLPAI